MVLPKVAYEETLFSLRKRLCVLLTQFVKEITRAIRVYFGACPQMVADFFHKKT